MTTIYEMGATDFNRPPIQVLFERLNASNSTFLDPKDWVLSHPVPSIDTPFNTTITALPIQTTYWSRGFNIDYNRAELSEQFSIGCEVRTGGAESAYAILDAINVAYGVFLTEEDIEDTSIEYLDSSKTSGPGTLELRARANSVFYIGTTTIRVNVTYEQGVAPYNDELTHYVVVARFKSFSGYAGVLALALIVIPVVIRTTENMLLLVPASLREAAYALGTPKWRVITMVTLRAARAGVITGVLLAVARIAGETAPLLFTALNNQFWNADLSKPMASLPVTIFKFAMSPYENWQELAWAGVFLITVAVLGLNILARVLTRQK